MAALVFVVVVVVAVELCEARKVRERGKQINRLLSLCIAARFGRDDAMMHNCGSLACLWPSSSEGGELESELARQCCRLGS